MADVQVIAGGAPTASTTLVNTDQVSIGGDGSIQVPIHTIAGGTAVVVDDVTITGDGTNAAPLAVLPLGLADRVPVLADAVTLVGNGTTGLPLTVVTGGGGGAVITDGVTIGGFGTAMVPLTAIFSGFDDNVKVAHDTTLSGDGTTGSPLSVISGAGTPRLFSYQVTGAEPDKSELVIPLPAVRANAAYNVLAFPQGITSPAPVPQGVSGKTIAQFVLSLSAPLVAGDVVAFYVSNPF